MKKIGLPLVLFGLLTASCGDEEKKSDSRTDKPGCTTETVDEGILVICGLTSTLISSGSNGERGLQGETGPRGETGAQGAAGADGTSCSVYQTEEGAAITCGETVAYVRHGEAGPRGEPGVPGEVGPQGEPGLDGRNGTDGVDGEDGEDGLPGTPGSLVTAVIPCPNLAGAYPEVLLCIEDKLYAVFNANPSQTRYAYIPPGSYRTTDGRSCNFQVVTGCTLN